MFALVSASDGTPIVISGPCWPFCMFVTLPLIVGISCLVIFFLILGETFALVRTFSFLLVFTASCLIKLNVQPNWILGIYIPSVLVVLVFLFFVSCRNPGLMERVTVRSTMCTFRRLETPLFVANFLSFAGRRSW
jgi:hypothetical protein